MIQGKTQVHGESLVTYELAWDRTRASAMKGPQLTASNHGWVGSCWPTPCVRPYSIVIFNRAGLFLCISGFGTEIVDSKPAVFL